MEKYKKLLSIIIPTKNRYETLIPVVSAILKHVDNKDIEIIVQDNSDSNLEGSLFFDQHPDSRLKYSYHQEPLSVQDNTIYALNKTSGKYIIFIGDDDLVSPNIYEITAQLDKDNIDCLIYKPAYYWWNSVSFVKETEFHQKTALWVPQDISLERVEKISKNELDFVIKNGAVSYFDLPRLYHGIVKKEVLEKIKDITGSYLPGACPDITSAAAISMVIDNYYYVNYPVSIFGASKNSGGGMSARNAHFGKIEDQKFLPKDILSRWDQYIPLIWSAYTYYANSVQEVLSSFGSKKNIKYEVLYGTMFAYEKNLSAYIYPAMKKYCGLNLRKYSLVFFSFVKKLMGVYYRQFRFERKKVGYDVLLIKNVDLVMAELKKIRNA